MIVEIYSRLKTRTGPKPWETQQFQNLNKYLSLTCTRTSLRMTYTYSLYHNNIAFIRFMSFNFTSILKQVSKIKRNTIKLKHKKDINFMQ